MRPDTPQTPLSDPRGSVPSVARDTSSQANAVANMTRDQIAAIFAGQDPESASSTPKHEPSRAETDQPTIVTAADVEPTTRTHQSHASAQRIEAAATTMPDDANVYDRTHQPARSVNAADWQQYHSQWQKYYQQYYEQYYVGAVQQTHEAYQQHATKLHEQLEKQTSQPAEMTEAEALHDLRSQLLAKVRTNAKKARKSRHFVPILSAAIVMIVFLFLQYNSMLLAYAQAYISPGNMNPQNIIVDPSTSLAVGPEPKLVIPKINVDVPVDYNAKPDYDSQMAAMKTSVAYFGIPGADSKPGQMGNTPMAGHSSNDFTDSGAAKFIFARLDQMQKGDIFYLHYQGKRYTYSVMNTMVVLPSEVTKLQIGQDKPYATLITCTPLGTAEKRLLVFGEQVSPSPSAAATAPAQSASPTTKPTMAGKSPTLIEQLFGAR